MQILISNLCDVSLIALFEYHETLTFSATHFCIDIATKLYTAKIQERHTTNVFFFSIYAKHNLHCDTFVNLKKKRLVLPARLYSLNSFSLISILLKTISQSVFQVDFE